ncbi:hypothetical protein BU24DRAFT_421461 [Aaosphaeria arxii CBS 175.79]|uniref:Uncharacterized protein n=1 Tax=Aaosphaeria arxii CBS 175.79 TaxID=1450172 RepID=A0A6A5XZT2_9PLEO|nr:uncharacterized protein BU24DRAFT_421461 [Aaosphaeria arxii CBS 175.79]KAF2018476.1 hypothetical protein BU24DRAFT_421461 [Aaosphaeria arxii CBS 175.79]
MPDNPNSGSGDKPNPRKRHRSSANAAAAEPTSPPQSRSQPSNPPYVPQFPPPGYVHPNYTRSPQYNVREDSATLKAQILGYLNPFTSYVAYI